MQHISDFSLGVWGKNNPILLLSVEKIRSQVGSFLMLKLQYSSQCRVCVGLKQSATDLASHWSRFPLQNCVSYHSKFTEQLFNYVDIPY